MNSQSQEVYFRDVKFSEAESAIKKILADIDAGKYDEELEESGIQRDPTVSLTNTTTLQQPSGLGPNEWYGIIVGFAPAVTYAAKSIWDEIVIPKLKRAFRVDQVSGHNPNKRK